MYAAWIWFGLGAVALIGEVLTGTFYLLMVAIGCVLAGVAAWFGLDIALQLVICAVVAVLATLLLRRVGVLNKRSPTEPARNADVNIDIGQTVNVETWNADRTARVWYRGAHWQVELEPQAPVRSGTHVITELRGSSLIVKPHG